MTALRVNTIGFAILRKTAKSLKRFPDCTLLGGILTELLLP
jgi:hypothetical protein